MGLTVLYRRIGKRLSVEVLKSERACGVWRMAYGEQIVATLSRELVAELGRGYTEKSLRRMTHFPSNGVGDCRDDCDVCYEARLSVLLVAFVAIVFATPVVGFFAVFLTVFFAAFTATLRTVSPKVCRAGSSVVNEAVSLPVV